MEIQLSSGGATAIFRFFFPAAWAVALLLMVLQRELPLFSVVLLLGSLTIGNLAWRLKRVSLHKGELVVHGLWSRVRFPLSELRSAQLGSRYFIPQLAFLIFQRKAGESRVVTFIPRGDSALDVVRSEAGFEGEWRRDV